MRIKVLLRESSTLVMIEEEDFEEALHIRVADEKTDDDDDGKGKGKKRTVGDITPEELAKGIGEAVGAGVRAALKEQGFGAPEKTDKGGQRFVAKENETDEPVTRFDDRTVAYARAARCVPGWEAKYKTLPAAERAIRTPESDVHTWRWMRGIADQDMGSLKSLAEHDKKRFADLDQNDPFIRATMGTTSTAVGGALVPAPLADLIVLKRDAKERLLPRAMQLTTDAETLTIPSEATVGAVAAVAENVAIGETDSTVGETVLTKHKVGRIARTSRELMESLSGAFSLSTILSDQAARKIGVFMDLQGAQSGDGTGTNHKNAIAQASLTTVAATTGALTRAKIVALILGLPTEWRDGTELTLMGNSVLTGLIANLVDGNGRPHYLPSNAPTVPMSDVGNAANIVEGIPYIELPFSANLLWVGCLRECFAVLNGAAMRVEVTEIGAGAFVADQLVWKFVDRRDSGVINADGFREAAGVLT